MSISMSSSDIMEKAKHEKKEITIVYMEQGNEIERIFNLDPGTLEGKKLRMTKKGERNSESLDDDNKTLFDYRIRNGAKITFTILENVGGKRALFKF